MFHTRSLKTKITLKSKSVSRDSDYGSQSHTLVTIASVWADVKNLKGDETFEGDIATTAISYQFKVHHRTDLNNINVISYDGLDYDITNVIPQHWDKCTLITAEFKGDEASQTATPITSFTYTNNNQSTGVLTPMVASVAGDVLKFTYDSNDTFPSGLNLNTSTGEITGEITENVTFDVIAIGADVNSSASVRVSHTFVDPLAAPSSLSATQNGSDQIDLSWTDNSTSETGFEIERSDTSGTGFSLIHTTIANATSYSDTGLSESTQYYYRLRATDGTNFSGYSNEDNATTLSLIPDLSPYGTILIDTEDLAARSTLTGDLIESISTAGSLGLTLSKFNDASRPEFLSSVSGVLNNKPVIVQHSQAKLQGSVTLRDRPAVWFAVVQRILYNKISVGASIGTGVQITLEDPLQTKVWNGQQIEIVASNAAGSLRVGRFTYDDDFERGTTVVTGDLIDSAVTSSHYFSTRNSVGERILRTDGSTKDYMLDSSSGGQQPTNRRFQAFDASNERATDSSNDSVEGPFILLMQYASSADGGVIVRVNGVEEDQQTATASTSQIGGTFSIGGKVTGVRGVARVYIGRCGWFDGKLDTEGGTVQASNIESALAPYFGITLP